MPPTPFDEPIRKLAAELNVAYVPYGADAPKAVVRQQQQDLVAATQPVGTAIERAVTKASQNYNNASWDLVDALEQKQAKLEEIADGELPEAIRSKSLEEKKAYVESQKARRHKIRQEIDALNRKREAYLAEQGKVAADMDTLDGAVLEAVESQMKSWAFEPAK